MKMSVERRWNCTDRGKGINHLQTKRSLLYLKTQSVLRSKHFSSRLQKPKLPKLIMEWIPGERRKRGRPRKTWMEGVRAAMRTRHLEADQWLNRKECCLRSGRRRQLSQDRKDR